MIFESITESEINSNETWVEYVNEILALHIAFRYKIWNLQKELKGIAPIILCKFRVAIVSPFRNGTLRENDSAVTYAAYLANIMVAALVAKFR